MPTTLEVHFDYGSPFAYLQAQLLPAIAERNAVELDWKPIDLLGLSNFSGGMPYSDKKRAYVFVDVLRCAEFHEIEIRTPKPLPVDSKLALRVALVGQDEGRFDAVHPELFRAAWRDQQDLGSDEVLQACIDAAGGQPGAWLERARSPELISRLEAATAASDDAGVFGVPTVIVNGELFWGVDALPVLEWRLGQLA